MNDTARLATIAEVADSLRISERKVFQLIADGSLETVKIGKARRITSESIDAYIERLKAAAA